MSRFGSKERCGRGGFTLMEVVLSAAVTAIILVGAQSAIVIASKAVPDGKGKIPASIRSAGVLESVSSDVCCAITVDEATGTAMQFTVPDRNGDGKPETIRYERTGKNLENLTRTFNGVAATVASNVQGFDLSYQMRSVAGATSYQEGPEVQVFSYNSAINLGSFAVTSSDFVGEIFTPTLPNGAVSWRLTRVQLIAQVHGLATGESRIQAWTATSSDPVALLAEVPMYESNLGVTFSPQNFALDQPGLAPGAPIAIIVNWVSGANSCDVQTQILLGIAPGATLVQTHNGGSNWASPATQQMPLTVWGKASSAAPTTYAYYLKVVGCGLTAGDGGGVRSNVSVRVLNEPSLNAAQAKGITDAQAAAAAAGGAAVGGAAVGKGG